MEQTTQPNQGKRIQGSLLILGAIAVGVGSGLGLNFFLPHRGDPMSAAAQTEEHEADERAESDNASDSAASASDTAVPAASSTGSETVESTTPPTDSVMASSDPEGSESATATMEPGSEPGSHEVAAAESETTATATADIEYVPEPAASEPAPAVAPSMPKKAKRASPPPAAQVLRSWWSSTSADPFAVEYVGQVQGQRAIAILFSRDVSDPAGKLKLIGADGKALDGGWKAGNSPRLLVRSDLKPGRYTVMIEQQLASADGQSLRVPLRGPIFIQ